MHHYIIFSLKTVDEKQQFQTAAKHCHFLR